MTGIYLGLGSNLGDREQNIYRCIKELSDCSDIKIVRLSSMYESEPYGLTDQPYFYNMVIEIETKLKPFQLLKLTQQIEKKLGRRETVRWGPRLIDIDILTYQDKIVDHPDLFIPHQQLHLRRFVLIPLKEISDNFVHPKLKQHIKTMLSTCKDKSRVKLIKP